MGDLRIPLVLVSVPLLAYGLAWNFFDQFFWNFGIELRTLSILPEHYFAWGTVIFVWTMLSEVRPNVPSDFIPHVFGALALASLLIPKEKMKLLRRVALTLATGLFVLAIFTRAGQLGVVEAAERAGEEFKVELAFESQPRPDASSTTVTAPSPDQATAAASALAAPEAALQDANEAGKLRLIWQDHDATVVGAIEQGVWTIFRVQTAGISVTRSSGVEVREQGDEP